MVSFTENRIFAAKSFYWALMLTTAGTSLSLPLTSFKSCCFNYRHIFALLKENGYKGKISPFPHTPSEFLLLCCPVYRLISLFIHLPEFFVFFNLTFSTYTSVKKSTIFWFRSDLKHAGKCGANSSTPVCPRINET